MKATDRGALIALLFALAVTAGGCSVLSPQPDRSRFFVLTPSPNSHSVAPAAVTESGPSVAVGLGPVTIPRYLRRPEVVTRISTTELAVSDNDRWAEPLNASVASVLAQDLSTDLPGVQIVPFPWSEKSQVRYCVSVRFLHLETTAGGEANVEAVWKIRESSNNRLVQSGTTTANRPAGAGPALASTALSEGIGQIGREIAQALREAKMSKQAHS